MEIKMCDLTRNILSLAREQNDMILCAYNKMVLPIETRHRSPGDELKTIVQSLSDEDAKMVETEIVEISKLVDEFIKQNCGDWACEAGQNRNACNIAMSFLTYRREENSQDESARQ